MNSILLIFCTAIVGIYYAKYEGLNILKSGFTQLSYNKKPKISVANPGIINNKAAKAMAAPDIIS